MTKNGKMQKVMIRMLAAMLVASFLLASLAWLTPVKAADNCNCEPRYEECWCDCQDHEEVCRVHFYNYCCNAGQGCWWAGYC